MGCSLASSLLLVATNAAGWVSALSVLVFGAPTMLILLAELARPVEWKESRLRAFRNLAFGARNGFVVGVLIFIPMFFVKLIQSPDGGPQISSFTLFITGLLAFVFCFFCDWIVSAFDFRLWMGDRSLGQVQTEDLFQSWEWEKTSQRWRRRGYFASSFWTLVPFFVRNKNDIHSIPALDWRTITFLIVVVIYGLSQGLQDWTLPLLAASIVFVGYTGTSFESLKRALGPYDATKLRELYEKRHTPMELSKPQDEIIQLG